MPSRLVTVMRDWRITLLIAVNVLLVLLAVFAVDGIRARHESHEAARDAVASANAQRQSATRRIDLLTDENRQCQARIVDLERRNAVLDKQGE